MSKKGASIDHETNQSLVPPSMAMLSAVQEASS